MASCIFSRYLAEAQESHSYSTRTGELAPWISAMLHHKNPSSFESRQDVRQLSSVVYRLCTEKVIKEASKVRVQAI